MDKASGGTYGALGVTAELRYARNIVVGHNAVEAIMRELSDQGPADPSTAKGARLARSSRSVWSAARSGAISRTHCG